MASNVISVSFGDQRVKKTKRVWQWNYGQILLFEDLDLPESYTVHFCCTGDIGTKQMVGDANGVEIPNEFLEDGRDIDAYVFLHVDEDDGETEYHAHIPIIQRPVPTTLEPRETQQSIIDQLIIALNNAVVTVRGFLLDAEAWAKGTRDGEEVTEEDETYHNNAAYYADLAGTEAGAAAGSAGAASDSAAAAASSATAAGQSASAASGSASAAAAAQAAAEQAEQDAQDLVDGAVDTVNAARDSAVQTVNAAGTSAVSAVNDAKQTAVQTVQQEGATQTAAAKAQADAAAASATAAHTSETNAAGSATAAAASQAAAKTSEDNAKSSEDAAKESEEAAAISAEAARHAAEGVISLNFTDFDTGTTYGYGLGIKDGHPALKIYENTEG